MNMNNRDEGASFARARSEMSLQPKSTVFNAGGHLQVEDVDAFVFNKEDSGTIKSDLNSV